MTLGFFEKIQSQMRDSQCKFDDTGSSFMPMYNDIEWGAKRKHERCEYNTQTVADYARRFPRGHLSFFRPGSEKK